MPLDGRESVKTHVPARRRPRTPAPPGWRARALAAQKPRERLRLLIEALRDEQSQREVKMRWRFSTVLCPEGRPSYEFPNFRRSCGTVGCAIGLAAHLWPELRAPLRQALTRDYSSFDPLAVNRVVGNFLGLSSRVVRETLLSTWAYNGRSYDEVGPGDVAAALERSLRRRPWL